MRRFLAGLIVGVSAAAIVLGVAFLSARQSAGGVDPLQSVEFRTYDWRLTRTAEPKTARQDLALVEIDEYSLRNLQPNAGRWPWPRAVHSMLIDYLQRAPAKVIAYDVDFAEADTRTGFDFGGDTWSGKESDQAFIDSVKKAGNVIMLADATYEGEATSGAAVAPDAGFTLDSPLVAERKMIFPPFEALAGAAAGLRSQPVRARPGRSAATHGAVCSRRTRALPSLGLAAALQGGAFRAVIDSSSTDDLLQMGERAMPRAGQAGAKRGRRPQLSVGARRLPRPGAACRPEEPPVSELCLLRSAVLGGADSRGAEAERRSVGLQGQDRVRRRDRRRAVRRVRDAVCRRQDAGNPDARRGRRRHPVATGSCAAGAPARVAACSRVRACRRIGVVATMLPAWWATAAIACCVGALSRGSRRACSRPATG